MSTRTDYELLDAWGGGDDAAGEELVARYVPLVYRFFRNKVQRDMEDLAQETFVACLEGRAAFRKSASFKTYLLSIARMRLLMYLRKGYRGERAMRLQEMSIEQLVGSPSAIAGRQEELKLLHRVMHQLPLDLQITLELFYWEELPQADIALVLDIPVGTVKSRLNRAREQLREQILSAEASEHLRKSTVHDLEDWARKLRDAFGR